MGREIRYFALPDDSKLFQLVEISQEHGEAAQFLHEYYSGSESKDENEIDKLFYAEARELRLKHPGIDGRTCYLDRYWDKLHFLLSEDRRNNRDHAEDYAAIAIFGQRAIHPNAVATQGAPLRSVPATVALLLAPWLNEISVDSLKSQYDPDLMAAANVYKFSQASSGTQELNWICEYFVRLKQFYQSIAEHHEGALVVLD